MEDIAEADAFIEDGDEVQVENDEHDEDPEESIAETSLNETVDLDAIEAKLEHLVPEVRRKESTMDAFKRLTLQRPWVPFFKGTGTKTAIDTEEEQLFEAMKSQYSRKASPRSKGGYYSFMIAWNMEVASQYKRQAEGEEDVIIINRKSIQQLQEHYDFVESRV